MYANVKSSTLVRDLRAESRSLGQAWLSLQDEVEQLERHKNLLRHEWKDLEEERERLKRERERFEKLVTQEWFPSSIDAPAVKDRVVRVNVGGQIFEITAKLLLKDRFSLLAASCLPEQDSILRPDEDGCYFFDRDWFLFRHILTYLQSNTLPQDVQRLRELHHEAGFYCLGSMQREIQTVLADIDNKRPEHGGGDDYETLLYGRSSPSSSSPSRSRPFMRAASASQARRRKAAADSSFAPELPDPFGFTARSTQL